MSGGWGGSTRRDRLPDNWDELRKQAHLRNPRRICHWCGRAGGEELDHKQRGDDHRLENLDWIHGWRSVRDGVSQRNCHGEKTNREAAEAQLREKRPPLVHPSLR